jgi:hypothetical protein
MWETANHMEPTALLTQGTDRFAYTVHIYNFVRDFTRAAFFKDFFVGGGSIFWKGTFLWDNILVGDSYVADIPRMNP